MNVTCWGDMFMGQTLNKHTEQKIIERLRGLPPQKLDEVIQFIDFIVEWRRSSTNASTADDLAGPIRALRGRGKGERLVERLLESRREDKRHNERK
jgi:hypothetical protein